MNPAKLVAQPTSCEAEPQLRLAIGKTESASGNLLLSLRRQNLGMKHLPIPVPTIVTSTAATAAAFTVLLDGKPATGSLNDPDHMMLVLSAALLALGGISIFFQAMLKQADQHVEIAEQHGEKVLNAMRIVFRICSLPVPWLLVGIGAMLCYRASPIASHLFMALIFGATLLFALKSGKLRRRRQLGEGVDCIVVIPPS